MSSVTTGTMKGYVFVGDNHAELREVPIPTIGYGEALGRLVHEQAFRLRAEGPRDRQHRLLAARQVDSPLV